MSVALVMPSKALAQAASDPPEIRRLKEQWYTGPLVAPNAGGIPQGMWIVQPYLITGWDNGRYDSEGRRRGSGSPTDSFTALSLLAYGITDRLMIQAIPQISHNWGTNDSSNGPRMSDLPVDLKYRLTNGVLGSWWQPAIAVSVGFGAPTGTYRNLRSPLDGLGNGAWYLREGIVLQSQVLTPGDHPLRTRLWASFAQPMSNPTVSGISSYGTDIGFVGQARPASQANFGVGLEYGLTHQWVLAFDAVYNSSSSGRLTGYNSAGWVNSTLSSSEVWSIAPAIEYNVTSGFGVLFGVQIPIAGRNASNAIMPQVSAIWVF